MALDKETAEVVTEGEKLYSLVQSEGWKLAKQKLDDLIKLFCDIRNIEATKPADEVLKDVQARQAVVDMVEEWVKSIEGASFKFKEQDVNLDNKNDSGFVVRQDG